jgi:hypothetical protein
MLTVGKCDYRQVQAPGQQDNDAANVRETSVCKFWRGKLSSPRVFIARMMLRRVRVQRCRLLGFLVPNLRAASAGNGTGTAGGQSNVLAGQE